MYFPIRRSLPKGSGPDKPFWTTLKIRKAEFVSLNWSFIHYNDWWCTELSTLEISWKDDGTRRTGKSRALPSTGWKYWNSACSGQHAWHLVSSGLHRHLRISSRARNLLGTAVSLIGLTQVKLKLDARTVYPIPFGFRQASGRLHLSGRNCRLVNIIRLDNRLLRLT